MQLAVRAAEEARRWSEIKFRLGADVREVDGVDPRGMNSITVERLTKRHGRVIAVNDLSFSVRRGAVTGFFGPNGAGKTTALAAIAGLARPTKGRAVVHGTLGVHIEACGAHPGRTARSHLRSLAALAGVPRRRVEEVLALVELQDAADRRAGGFSLGMRQRLGLASALLGDPDVLILDEPLNGLDPRGIRWVRELLRARAAAGGTVLISSHLLAEAEQTVDEVLVLHGGRLVHQGPADGSLEDLFFEVTA
jgi:ABC-2 type transport system ATP-binding protein